MNSHQYTTEKYLSKYESNLLIKKYIMELIAYLRILDMADQAHSGIAGTAVTFK